MSTNWLNELIDEYATQNITKTRALRLGRAYANEPADIMDAAVLAYIRENKYFPKTADLNPYVTQAHENARGDVAYPQLQQQLSYGRFGHGPYTDDDILEWEQARGNMTQPGTDWLTWSTEPAEGFAREHKEITNAN